MSEGPLAELVAFANGRSRPPAGSGYPVYGANGVIGTAHRFNAGPESTVVGRVGSYCGTVHYSRAPCWVTDNAIIATAKDGVNPRYAYYLLKRLGLNRHRIGSGQPLLTQAILNRLTVRHPTRAEQDSAASVLGALDDKTAANHRLATIADALIRARYEEASAMAVGVTKIGELADQVRSTVRAAQIRNDENYIALEHLPKRHMWLSAWSTATGITSAKRRFAAGDVLFGRLRPYFHKVGIAFVDGVTSTDILVVRPKQTVHRSWLLAALASDEVVAHASAVGDGTRMPRVKWQDIAGFDVPWPGENDARQFHEFVTPLASRIQAATSENARLATLRDTLLPTLIP